MSDFDTRLADRLRQLDASVPSPASAPRLTAPTARRVVRVRRLTKRGLVLALAAVLVGATAVTANRILYPDLPEPRLEAAVEALFSDGECRQAEAVQRRVREAMDQAGYGGWTIALDSGADRARCVGAGVISPLHEVRLYAIAGREVLEAMEWLQEQLFEQCLNRPQAIQLAASVMHSLGISNFEVRTDPWGPQAVPLDGPGGPEAYIEHARSCFVYSTIQQENGRSVIYLWGPWL